MALRLAFMLFGKKLCIYQGIFVKQGVSISPEYVPYDDLQAPPYKGKRW